MAFDFQRGRENSQGQASELHLHRLPHFHAVGADAERGRRDLHHGWRRRTHAAQPESQQPQRRQRLHAAQRASHGRRLRRQLHQRLSQRPPPSAAAASAATRLRVAELGQRGVGGRVPRAGDLDEPGPLARVGETRQPVVLFAGQRRRRGEPGHGGAGKRVHDGRASECVGVGGVAHSYGGCR